MFQSRPFFMCGNPNGVKFKRKLTAINSPFYLARMTFRFTWPAWLHDFCNLTRLILEKGGYTPVLVNHKKEIFRLKRAFLGKSQRPVRRLSNQTSSFRLETHQLFLTYVQSAVMLHYYRFSYAGNWELVQSIVGTKFRRSHVCLHS